MITLFPSVSHLISQLVCHNIDLVQPTWELALKRLILAQKEVIKEANLDLWLFQLINLYF